MQLNTITNQTIALAGIAQAAALVQQLATKGSCDAKAFESSITSILKIDSDSVIDVYGSLDDLQLGIKQLNTQMSNFRMVNPEQARYSAALVFLENQLSSRTDLLNTIHIGVVRAQSQTEHFGALHLFKRRAINIGVGGARCFPILLYFLSRESQLYFVCL